MKMILASKNEGKVKEFRQILEKFNIELLSLKDLNFDGEILEDGLSFEENSLIKAKAIYTKYGIPTIADDSGICVDALNGEPGIYSARYGDLNTDIDRRNLLLKNMIDIQERSAYFHCSIILYLSKDNFKHFEGRVYGILDYEAKGDNGFGYDPIFIPNGYDISFGQLSDEIKNEISHRALAMKSLIEFLENDFNI